MAGRLRKLILGLLVLMLLFSVLFPFYWMVASSFKTFEELFSETPAFFPEHISLKSYREAFEQNNLGIYMVNSFKVSGACVLITLVLAVLAAYAIARLRFRGKGASSIFFLLVYLFPAILLMIPLFIILSRLHLQDTHTGLIITYVTQTLPVAVLMLANYFRSIPFDIEEAALVDGCSRAGVIRRVTLPLAAPAIATVALYIFVIAWNEFLFAYVYLNSTELFTLPIGINQIYQSLHTEWDQVMAASVIVTVPVIILFIWFERYLVAGLTGGGVKG